MLYLGEIYFFEIFDEDIEKFGDALSRVGYYIKKSDDTDAEENQYDIFKSD